MDIRTRHTLVEAYKSGYRLVAEALAGATEAELDVSPAPGKWSSREIVHHLADSEMTSAIRLRLLIASENPAILGYDQDAYAQRLHYRGRPIAASLAAFKAARETTAEILERMSDAEWQREGTHNEHGRYTVYTWLELYAQHAHAHAEQIRVALAAARQGGGRT